MNVVASIPDDLATRIAAEGGDLERRALKALVLEEFRASRMTKELPQALGFEALDEVDGFLKARDVYEQRLTQDEMERIRL